MRRQFSDASSEPTDLLVGRRGQVVVAAALFGRSEGGQSALLARLRP